MKIKGFLFQAFLLLTVLSSGFRLEQAHAMPGNGATISGMPENVSTNYTVSSPGLVTIAFTSSNGVSYIQHGATAFGINPADIGLLDLLSNTNSVAAGIPSLHGPTPNLSVLDPSGNVIAYLILANTSPNFESDVNFSSAVSVSGQGVSANFSGNFNNNGASGTLSYSSSSGSSTANTSFTGLSSSGSVSGTMLCDANIADNDNSTITFTTSLNYSGTFSFYAPAAGSYTIKEVAAGQYEQQALPPLQAQLPGDPSSSPTDITPNVGATSQELSIQSITNVPASQAPSGTLTVSKVDSGAGGIQLSWTITPPDSSKK